ncbi:Cl channel CLC-3 [Umbelopsis sp. AD052]|nr:Cl channel CLC-3 [Umbelopsis sp. AD052]
MSRPGHTRSASSQIIDEDLQKAIQRYEDFTTTDWVKDAVHERQRKSALQSMNKNSDSWRSWWALTFESAQTWIVISLVGATIGLNSALIAIITDWLSDIKMGYCSTGWWLNQKFCCWGIEEHDGTCEYWTNWSEPLGLGRDVFVVKWMFYIAWATCFAGTCAFLVKHFAPYAAGSGISEIKCILAGFTMKGFLGGWTLLMKSVGLALAVASNLSIGKEGPSVHMACCVGHVISRLFANYRQNKAKMREILSASSAAGVAVAFGSPIGGVLFSLEEMSANFPNKTMLRSFFCALIATMVLQAMNPFRTGKLVMFQVTYDRDWHFFEYFFTVIIGIFGGLYGAFVIKFNMKVVEYRKKYLKDYAIAEAAVLALVTAIIAYPNVFLRIDMTEIMGILFRECEGPEGEDYYGLCQQSEVGRMITLLLFATILRTIGTIFSYGCKVPCGIFVPSMAIGATFGRMLGLIAKSWQSAYPDFFLFASCQPDVPCITPGTYAFLGAAAALCGVMRITVSVVVIMFELTGRVTYILPSMITLIVTKATADWFGKGGIADRYIQVNGYPFLDKEEHSFGVPVSHVMRRDPVVMTASGMKLHEIETIFHDTQFGGFPVVQDKTSMTLVGYIGRSEMLYLIEKAKRINRAHGDTKCDFRPVDDDNGVEVIASYSEETQDFEETNSEAEVISFGPYVDQTPITVRPQYYLETVMDLFKKIGPRIILIENLGKVVGLITVKDVLRYIAQIERRDHKSDQQGSWNSWLEQRNWHLSSYTRIFSRDSEENHELQ